MRISTLQTSVAISKEHIFALERVLEDKPAAYDAADLEQGRAILFSTIRDVMSTERATACIEAIRALVDAEVDTALEAHGVRTS